MTLHASDFLSPCSRLVGPRARASVSEARRQADSTCRKAELLHWSSLWHLGNLAAL